MPVDDGKTYFSPEAEMLARENEQLRRRIADLQDILGLNIASSRLEALETSVHQRFASVWDKMAEMEATIELIKQHMPMNPTAAKELGRSDEERYKNQPQLQGSGNPAEPSNKGL